MTVEFASSTRLGGHWVPLARLSWAIVALSIAILYVVAVPLRFERARFPCDYEECLPLEASPEGAVALEQELGLTLDTYAILLAGIDILAALVFTVAGALIFWRKSDDWMALLVSLALLLLGTGGPSLLVALAAARPDLRLVVLVWQVVGTALLVVLFFLFPSGNFVPRWTRWPALVLILGMFALASGYRSFGPIWFTVILGGMAIGVYAQIYRYRRVSSPVERQQTKWVVLGFALGFLGLISFAVPPILFPGLLDPISAPMSSTADFVYKFPFNLIFGFVPLFAIPVSIAISTLRYRLWDADLVITRSLVYGALTAMLAMIYFSGVLILQGAFRVLTGQGSPLAIVGSTLVIAALFSPLRSRLKRIIDRRFYRRKYDAEQTMTMFGAAVRDQVDMERLSEELLTVVARTMQPKHLSLWLRKSP